MVKNSKDFKIGIGFTIFCLFCLFYLIPRHVGRLTEAESLMPVIVVFFILVLGILLTINSLRFVQGKDAKPHDTQNRNPATLITVIVIMIAFAWMMDYLGFLLSSSLAMVILFVIFGVRNYKRIVLITSITLTVLYIAFEKLLVSPLPVGTLIERFIE